MAKMKVNVKTLKKMKNEGIPVTWITAYDLPFASAAENAGIDMILVGDSGGMVQLGYETTNPVTMDEMITLSKSARRGAPNTFIIGDMPQGSYEVCKEKAVENAMRFIKESRCDAVKCEGGRRVADKIKAIVDAGILVFGHLGLTPQSTSSFGGYNVQGKTIESFEETVEDALALQEAGVMALLIEATPAAPAGQIAKMLDIPVYGIGAGSEVDGQLIIMHDLMGFYQSFRPWFAKCYIPEVIKDFEQHITSISDIRQYGRDERRDGLFALAEMAIVKYIEEVKKRTFPGDTYSYPIKEEQLNLLKQSKYWNK
nr:3-methyl-2-oxobutanoate hydroxymethyltransferase [Odoribacter splanchnicus]